MSYSRRRLQEVVDLQKGIVKRIETDLGEFGASSKIKYIQEFTDEFQRYESVCKLDEIMARAGDSHVVWIGDYHALSRSREFASQLLRRLAAEKNSSIALGVEVVFARNQKLLDQWLAGSISETDFLERTRYAEEWGCDWPSYRNLFAVARELGVPVYGVDCHPRRDLRSIGRRDQNVARRIAQLLRQSGSRTLVVLFGESHLASNHLPQRVRTILEKNGEPFSDLLVLQNIDKIYWRLQGRGLEGVGAVRIGPGKYCVFNSTPLEKYESFRQYLHECTDDEDGAGDWTRLVHTLIEGMFEFLDIEQDPEVVEELPRVYSDFSAGRLPDFLSREEVQSAQIRNAIDYLQEKGTRYVPELNSIFIDRFSLDSAAEEAARFIFHAFRAKPRATAANRGAGAVEGVASDVVFLAVIEHALGYFCSKLLDSSRDGIEALGNRVLGQMGSDEEFARTAPYLLDPRKKPSVQHFENLIATIEQNAGRHKLLRLLAQMLGYALGRRLYRAYLESRISRKEIQALFRDPLAAPEDALLRYVELNNRLS